MRALTSSSARTPLAWTELPSLPLKSTQVRIDVRAVGVNPVDWKMRDGEFLGVMHRLLGPRGPLVVGVDVAGVVTEVGAEVHHVAVGDRVVASTDFSKGERGSYAEEAVVSAANCAKLPDSVDFDVAGALPVAGATAWIALLEIGNLAERKSPRVLVLGASGGVGHVAVQLARRAGAKVVGVCSTRNVALVEGYGAKALDYTQGDLAERAMAEGPFDVVLDCVGSETYARSWCTRLLAPTGVHIQVVPRAADLLAIALPNRTKTVFGRASRERLEGLVAAISAGELEVRLAERIPLSEAERAHTVSRGGKVVGKLVLCA
jgi:NADPH:quinone reductase-like Zn-dependent oxidoreductase